MTTEASLRILLSWFIMLFSLTPFVPATAAVSKATPRTGNCYMLSTEDRQASSWTSPPVKCSRPHNSEVYVVAKWPSKIPPFMMTEDEGRVLAKEVCIDQNWSARLGEYFDYWAWFAPDKKAWNKGARWLRCDAMKLLNYDESLSSDQYEFEVWAGRRS